MYRFLLLTAVSVGILGFGSVAQASGSKALFRLADQYRTAVDTFETIVFRVRGVDRSDKRLVDRLDDAVATDAAGCPQPETSQSALS